MRQLRAGIAIVACFTGTQGLRLCVQLHSSVRCPSFPMPARTLAESRALVRVLTTSSWYATSLTLFGRLQRRVWRQGPAQHAPQLFLGVRAALRSSTHYFSTQGCISLRVQPSRRDERPPAALSL